MTKLVSQFESQFALHHWTHYSDSFALLNAFLQDSIQNDCILTLKVYLSAVFVFFFFKGKSLSTPACASESASPSSTLEQGQVSTLDAIAIHLVSILFSYCAPSCCPSIYKHSATDVRPSDHLSCLDAVTPFLVSSLCSYTLFPSQQSPTVKTCEMAGFSIILFIQNCISWCARSSKRRPTSQRWPVRNGQQRPGWWMYVVRSTHFSIPYIYIPPPTLWRPKPISHFGAHRHSPYIKSNHIKQSWMLAESLPFVWTDHNNRSDNTPISAYKKHTHTNIGYIYISISMGRGEVNFDANLSLWHWTPPSGWRLVIIARRESSMEKVMCRRFLFLFRDRYSDELSGFRYAIEDVILCFPF